MKDIIFTVDGKEYRATITEEQLAELIKNRPKTGFERVEQGCRYYSSINYSNIDNDTGFDKSQYEIGDYINDEKLFQDRCRAKRLHDMLEQWQALNDECVGWLNGKEKVRIRFDYSTKTFAFPTTIHCREEGVVYFSTIQKAQEACKVFRDELMWYYTKYRTRLDEPARR